MNHLVHFPDGNGDEEWVMSSFSLITDGQLSVVEKHLGVHGHRRMRVAAAAMVMSL
jgi:hypothetical protein